MLHLFEFGEEELMEPNENGSTTVIEKPSTSNTIETSEPVPVDRLMLNLLSEQTR